MVDECASCEAGDELLFTCSYCDEQFCSAHQFPHHACEGFGRAAEAGDPPETAEWLPASALGEGTGGWDVDPTVDADDPAGAGEVEHADTDGGVDPTTTAEGATEPVTVTPPEPSARAESLSADTWGGSGGLPVKTGDGVVNVRAMDSRRVVGGAETGAAPRTVGDWISRQTYLTLTVKVGVIALLVNAAFYGGMAVTLHGLLPFLV
jgi:hypothetical protein